MKKNTSLLVAILLIIGSIVISAILWFIFHVFFFIFIFVLPCLSPLLKEKKEIQPYKCPNCGATLKGGENYCPVCGNKLQHKSR